MVLFSDHKIPFPQKADSIKKSEWNLTRKIWAARRLASLEGIDDPAAITSFAIQERLVSDYTSLIVLEQFSDHLRYNIPPPEPDLLTRYENENRKEAGLPIQSLANAWLKKKKWHQPPFAWFDADLQQQVEFVGIWIRSLRVVFPKKKLNKRPIREYEAWNLQAKKTIQKRAQAESGKQFKNWVKELDQRITELHKIRSNAPKADPAGNIHVSLRGAVKERGIFTEPATTTLQEVIREAGGTSEYRDMVRVFLYRNAARTGYNLLNRETKPIPLQWGDMIVVESPPRRIFNSGDPFAAPADPFFGSPPTVRRSEGAELMNGPAVFETPGTLRTRRIADRPENKPEAKTGQHRIESDSPALPREAIFFTKLDEHPDPWKFCERSIRNQGGLTIADTIKIARFFFNKNNKNEGTRVLSNLFELLANPIEASRSYAYWISEFGNPDEGERILRELLDTPNLDYRTRALLYFDIGQITNRAAPFRKSIAEELKSGSPSDLATIALTDAFAREEKAFQKIAPYRMSSDYRIVITSMGQEYQISVLIPERFRGFMNDESSRQISSSGVAEHQSIKALPGIAAVELVQADPGTYHVQIYQKFGSPQQKMIASKTIYVSDQGNMRLGEIDFLWDDIEIDSTDLPVGVTDPFEGN